MRLRNRVESSKSLLLEHVLKRTRGTRQGHVDNGIAVLDGDAIDEAEVDDVNPELGIDDVLQRFGAVLYADVFRIGQCLSRPSGGREAYAVR